MSIIDNLSEVDFPLEIWELISYYLDPYSLAICKFLSQIYNNDRWYYYHLNIKYPNLNLYTKTNYQNLYKLSLKQGDIYYIDKTSRTKIPINSRGIKIEEWYLQ